MASFGGGKAFAGHIETGVMLGALAVHGALQNGIAAGQQAKQDARVFGSVNRLATAFKLERWKSTSLAQQLEVERARRKFAEFKIAKKEEGGPKPPLS